MLRFARQDLLGGIGISTMEFKEAWTLTDSFLLSIPADFLLTPVEFYSVLNQRNLSGFVGEVFKHAVAAVSPSLVTNPHPDGRPDLLDLSKPEVRQHFDSNCFDARSGSPIRSSLSPFAFGGVEVKASIGSTFSRPADQMPIGIPRSPYVTDLTYWAHHRHACTLLGLLYDFDPELGGAPQLSAAFLTRLTEDDWQPMSIGKQGSKKTSNTSLSATAKKRVKNSILAYRSDATVMGALERLNVPVR